LFCPNRECNARIVYASGEELKYFRTWPWRAKGVNGEVVNEHIDGCPYIVEHELGEKQSRRTDPNALYQLSLEHVKRVLNNAYDAYKHPEKRNKPNSAEDAKKRPSTKSKVDSGLEPRGQAGLVIDGASEKAEKEPSVFRKNIDDISETDYGNMPCVVGPVAEMVIEGDHPYITFLTKDHRKARILFSEAFAVNSPEVFRNIGVYKNYIDSAINEGVTPTVCCIGKIVRDDYEVSVVFEDYHCLQIENKGYYQIVNEIHRHG
jgi:hypothetical protein